MNNNGGLQVGIADDQAKDFDFEKTEMKYDSTGMFHWGPAKNLEECILVRYYSQTYLNGYLHLAVTSINGHFSLEPINFPIKPVLISPLLNGHLTPRSAATQIS